MLSKFQNSIYLFFISLLESIIQPCGVFISLGPILLNVICLSKKNLFMSLKDIY